MVSLTFDPGNPDERCSVVVHPVALDFQKQQHLVVDSVSKVFYRVDGYLREGCMSYSFLNVFVKPDGGYHRIVVDADSFVLTHSTCDWSSMYSVIELCCGSGYLGIGARVAGFKTVLGCDSNKKFTDHFQQMHNLPTVTGNVCDASVISEIWSKISSPCGIAAGISCQPYSYLGDQRSGSDERSQSLPGVLKATHYLRAPYALLECVEPANQDTYVQEQIASFCAQTGYTAHQVILKLQDVWPCRRGRWWCLLLSPALGTMTLTDFPQHTGLQKIAQIITHATKLEPDELSQLLLHDDENQAFGVDSAGQSPHMVNMYGQLPCALHSWGNPLQACPCSCRDQGLSRQRLQDKGLHGVVLPTDTPGMVRHIHPSELAVLNGVDPVQNWEPLRFSLCSLGQLASPLQSLWMLSQLKSHLDKIYSGTTTVSPFRDLNTYMGWLIARSKLVWDPKVTGELGMIAKTWEPVTTFTLDQLFAMDFWEHQGCDGLSLTEIFQMILRAEPNTSLYQFLQRELAVLKDAVVVEDVDIPPTVPFEVEDMQGVWVELGDATIQVNFSRNATVSDLIAAECRLTDGKEKITCMAQGCELSPDSLLCSGQTVQICFQKIEGESGPLPSLMPCDETAARETSDDHDPHMPGETTDDQPDMVVDTVADGTHGDDPTLHADSSHVEVPDASMPDHAVPETAAPVPSLPLVSPTPLVHLDKAGLLRLEAPMPSQHSQVAGMLVQAIKTSDRIRILDAQELAWADDEIRWHLNRLFDLHVARLQESSSQDTPYFKQIVMLDPLLLHGWIATEGTQVSAWCQQFDVSKVDAFVLVAPIKGHWVPFIAWVKNGQMNVKTWDEQDADHSGMLPVLLALARGLGIQSPPVFYREHRLFIQAGSCGALSISFVAHMLFGQKLPMIESEATLAHAQYRAMFQHACSTVTTCSRPWLWGLGSQEQTTQQLAELLEEQGVPRTHCNTRAQAAIAAIGVKAVSHALTMKHPWKQLKTLGNHVKFQFLLPSELQTKVQHKPPRKHAKKHGPLNDAPQQVELDPEKLIVATGTFHSGGEALNQIGLHQIGPLAEGIVVVTPLQAEPYLRANQLVSSCPLALLIVHGLPEGVNTALPLTTVSVPSRCSVDKEPILFEAAMVQLGTGFVEKTQDKQLISVATMDVATVKFMLYKDEIADEWDQVIAAPLRYIVGKFPMLTLCETTNCQCPRWHNPKHIPTKTVIQDVWRRQFLRLNFKPEVPEKAILFTVCVRIPTELLKPVLEESGKFGIYGEPRSPDGREIAQDFSIVWAPRVDHSELIRLRQTTPEVIGLARIGDRKGLRVLSSAAQTVHEKLRPGTVYLASGPRQQYVVGPMPYGSDRTAISKALSQLHWEAKPMQPIASRDGKGAMWVVQALEEPPQRMYQLSHGEIVITKHKTSEKDGKSNPSVPIASPTTLALCGTATKHKEHKEDPWAHYDPWQKTIAEPTAPPTDSLKRIEQQIEHAVLARLPQPQPDTADRLTHLETQMQTMMAKHTSLEKQVKDSEARQTGHIVAIQQQVNQQGQQLQGALEMQQQNMAAMFDAQMTQIRGLLRKRPNDETDAPGSAMSLE
eukprot:Skav202559  [mRNA]  locus=scaffold2177:27236:31978:+ [translate_table: standard]